MHAVDFEKTSLAGALTTALRFSLLMLLVCGLLYSTSVTLLGGLLFPARASGSLIQRDGQVIGSVLVAQPFNSARYFHSRPSAVNHDPTATGGSNLAPSNPALRERVTADSIRIQRLDGVSAHAIPVDLLAASGSGIDPHISPAAAALQAARVARARNLDIETVRQLIARHTEAPQWGLFGQPRVNVLRLNLALDAGAETDTRHD